MSTVPAQSPAPQPRITRQRLAVASLMADLDEFNTAQQVHELLRQTGQSIGLATVYRQLQSLAEAGEVDAVRQPEGEMAYRRCASPVHHHHLICRNCGRAVEISAGVVEQWAAQVAAEHGYRDAGHELELYGLCSQC